MAWSVPAIEEAGFSGRGLLTLKIGQNGRLLRFDLLPLLIQLHLGRSQEGLVLGIELGHLGEGRLQIGPTRDMGHHLLADPQAVVSQLGKPVPVLIGETVSLRPSQLQELLGEGSQLIRQR